MTRSALALGLLLATTGVALADIPPPPPPKGFKYISVQNELIISKEVSGYTFVEQVTNYRPAPQHTFTKLDVKGDKGVKVSVAQRRMAVSLIAVPADAAKEFKTDQDLFEALEKRAVKGAQVLAFTGSATVPDSIKGESVKWTTTVTAIDQKGIQSKVEGEGYGQGPKEKRPRASAGPVVAGVLAALALALGGAWFVGRARRKSV